VHVQAGGGACLTGPDLDKITDLADQPQALTARQVNGRGPVTGERVGDLAGIGDLAEDLSGGSPDLYCSAAVGMAQGVGRELADRAPGRVGLEYTIVAVTCYFS
jgi:hypothetical protein